METRFIYQIRRIANSIRRVIGAITFRGRAEKLVARKGCSLRGLCTRRVCASSPAGASRSRETQEMAVATNCIINQRWKGWPATVANFFSRTISRGLYDTPLSSLSLSLANFRPIDLSHDQNDRSSSRFATQPTCARFTWRTVSDNGGGECAKGGNVEGSMPTPSSRHQVHAYLTRNNRWNDSIRRIQITRSLFTKLYRWKREKGKGLNYHFLSQRN